MVPASVPDSCTALATIVSSTVSQVERRIDRLADLAERAQLLDRLRELAGAQLDLLLQVGIGFLQPAAMSLNWSASPSSSSPVLIEMRWLEIAAADARGAGAQRLDRHHHAAGEEQPGEKRQHQRRRAAAAPERLIES